MAVEHILQVKKLRATAILPCYAHDDDAGMDLFAAETLAISPGEVRIVATGIAVQLPAGTEGQIRPRSGLALRHGVTVLNSPGTVDAGYRGELGVILVNHGVQSVCIEAGSRIAQLVISPILRVRVTEAAELSASERATRGFGSTGS